MMNTATQPKTTHVMTRQRRFEAVTNANLVSIIEDLISEKHTGPVRIEMAQGGIRCISVEDHVTLQPEDCHG